MKNNLRKIFTIFSIIVIGLSFSGNAYAAEKKKFKWISFEVEIMKLSLNKCVGNTVVNRVPLYVRTIPTHRDDLYRKLDPMEEMMPFEIPIKARITELILGGIKVWFLHDTIGFGFGIRASHPEVVPNTEPGLSPGFEKKGPFDETISAEVKYNYAPLYGSSWGDVFTMYRIGAVQEGKLKWLRYFVEVKTPTIFMGEGFGFSLFGGYEPNVSKMVIHATNGWHRWNKFELKDHYKLGEINSDRAYVGLNLKIVYDPYDGKSISIKFFVAKNLQKTRVFSAGEDFGLEFREPPLMFGVGLSIHDFLY